MSAASEGDRWSPGTELFPLTVGRAVSRVRQRNRSINAFITTRLDEALADAASRNTEPGARSPLHGVPYGLKDEWETAALRTTAGSYRHRERVPRESSPVHTVFESAGAVLLGKTNLSDLGLAPEASSWIGGPTRNPYDLRCTAGGSSGGSAAAVADGMIAFDWGTDMGGSIRLPAAFCGVFGMRLSSETWPIAGMFPRLSGALAPLCAQGPIAGSLPGMRAVLAVAAPRLRTGASRSFVARRIVLQCPARLGKWPTVCADVRGALRAAFDAELGTESLPSPEEARRAFAAMWASHFEDVLSWEPSIDLRRGLSGVVSAIVLRGALGDRAFHPTTAELVALIALGRVTLFRDRASAVRAAKGVADGFRAAWDKGYIVASPVCTVPAPRIGRANRNLDLLTCTVAGNLADATAIAIPAGAFPGGMPRAIQLMGPPGSEEEILSVAERVVGHFADAGINTNVSR